MFGCDTNSPSSVFNFAPSLKRHNISVANGSIVPVLGNGKINFFLIVLHLMLLLFHHFLLRWKNH